MKLRVASSILAVLTQDRGRRDVLGRSQSSSTMNWWNVHARAGTSDGDTLPSSATVCLLPTIPPRPQPGQQISAQYVFGTPFLAQ